VDDPFLGSASGSTMTGEFIFITGVRNCTEALETDAAGNIFCGTDETGGSGTFGTGNVITIGDLRYVNLSGDTMTGNLILNSSTITATGGIFTGTLSVSGATSIDGDISAQGGITCTDCIALTTETSGNYADGDGEAGAALTGDSATAFFSSGMIELARGGTNASLTASAGAMCYSTASAIAFTAVGSQDEVMRSNAAGAPGFAAPTSTGFITVAFESTVSMVAREAFHKALFLKGDSTFTDIHLLAALAPTGSSMIFDIRECDADCSTSCASMFSTRPEIDAGALVDDNNHVISDSTLEEGACYLYDVDQIGSTVGGSGATIQPEFAEPIYFP